MSKTTGHIESKVLEKLPIDEKMGQEYFASKLEYETDSSDVYMDLKNGVKGIIVVDARTPDAFARGHVPGAINLPYRTIDASTTHAIPRSTVIVTYCDGTYCNASTKAAARLSNLGYRVKEMLDGMRGWKIEGYPIEESILTVTSS